MKFLTSERLSRHLLPARIRYPSEGSGSNGASGSQTVCPAEAMPTTAKCRRGVVEVCVGHDLVALPSTASNEQAIARIEQHLRGTNPSTHEAIDLAPPAIARVTSL